MAVGAAGLWRNPTLKFEAEGVGGDLDLYDEAEYTIGILQQLLRGSKRRAEQHVAVQDVVIAGHLEAERRLGLERQVREAFVEVMAQQEIGSVRSEQIQLGRAFVEVARRRLDAGAGSELEVVQAELALDEIALAQTCCFGDLAAARARLSSLLGLPVEQLPALAGAYYELEVPGDPAVGLNHPALLRLEGEAARILAQAERARLTDKGDITLGFGIKHEAAEDLDTFVLSASMPLGFIRRGRAEYAAGLLKARAVQFEREEMRRQLLQEMDTLTEFHKGTIMEVTLTRDNLLPRAEEAYALSLEGYEAGRFSWLELIEAQQHLAEIRVRYIEALLEAHRIEAKLAEFRRDV
jgi:cobalt-zinc-cadmium efflux system outer membrane protein